MFLSLTRISVAGPLLRAEWPAVFHRVRQRRRFRRRLRRVDPFYPIASPTHRPGANRDQGNLLLRRSATLAQARPAPALGSLDHARPHRIPLDVPQQLREMPIILHRKRFEPTLIHRPIPHPMAMLHPAPDVRHRQPMHEPRQLAIPLRPKHQVPMIGHQAEPQHPHRKPLQRLVKRPDEPREVAVMAKQLPLSRRAVQHVINQSPRRSSCLPWHERAC